MLRSLIEKSLDIVFSVLGDFHEREKVVSFSCQQILAKKSKSPHDIAPLTSGVTAVVRHSAQSKSLC